ncbi:hypothetical protein TB2_017791 [Malus domestica]
MDLPDKHGVLIGPLFSLLGIQAGNFATSIADQSARNINLMAQISATRFLSSRLLPLPPFGAVFGLQRSVVGVVHLLCSTISLICPKLF